MAKPVLKKPIKPLKGVTGVVTAFSMLARKTKKPTEARRKNG